MKQKVGTCYVCATPIGNLTDCTHRLISTLHAVDLIAAEDTRHTSILCQKYSISTPLISIEKHQESIRTPLLIKTLQSGKDIAVVSDAGTPTISDPGALAVLACHKYNIPVCPIPGANAITTLLSVSGCVADTYIFVGFFPKKDTEAAVLISSFSCHGVPIICFESPRRLINTITWVHQHYPDAYCVLGKELTKVFETIITGTPHDILMRLSTMSIKGEWTLLFHPPKAPSIPNQRFLAVCHELSLSKKDIIRLTQSLGWSKNDIYSTLLEMS